LQKAERLNVWEQLEAKTTGFCQWLNTQFDERGLPFEMTHFASLFWLCGKTDAPIRSITQIPAEHGAKFARIFHAALARGVYLAPSGYEVGFVSLAHTDTLLEQAAQILLEAVSTK
jgi:glutamate-1-semialdehyde 2,1-aminomutase